MKFWYFWNQFLVFESKVSVVGSNVIDRKFRAAKLTLFFTPHKLKKYKATRKGFTKVFQNTYGMFLNKNLFSNFFFTSSTKNWKKNCILSAHWVKNSKGDALVEVHDRRLFMMKQFRNKKCFFFQKFKKNNPPSPPPTHTQKNST